MAANENILGTTNNVTVNGDIHNTINNNIFIDGKRLSDNVIFELLAYMSTDRLATITSKAALRMISSGAINDLDKPKDLDTLLLSICVEHKLLAAHGNDLYYMQEPEKCATQHKTKRLPMYKSIGVGIDRSARTVHGSMTRIHTKLPDIDDTEIDRLGDVSDETKLYLKAHPIKCRKELDYDARVREIENRRVATNDAEAEARIADNLRRARRDKDMRHEQKRQYALPASHRHYNRVLPQGQFFQVKAGEGHI